MRYNVVALCFKTLCKYRIAFLRSCECIGIFSYNSVSKYAVMLSRIKTKIQFCKFAVDLISRFN